MTDPELVEAAIRKSKLSPSLFAQRIMAGRTARTINRWRLGQVEIPPQARKFLISYLRRRVRKPKLGQSITTMEDLTQ